MASCALTGPLDPVGRRAGQLIQDKIRSRLRQWSGTSARVGNPAVRAQTYFGGP